MTQSSDELGRGGADPAGKQHGDPLLSTRHGNPEEGSRQGESPDKTPSDTDGD